MSFFDGKMKKILVVDDSVIDLDLVEVMLKDRYTILPTKSGKEALDYLFQAGAPDLILLDLMMPDMDGWETFDRIRALGSIAKVPIAFLTSSHGTAEQDRAREMGAADYIFKPFSKKELLKRVEAIMKEYPMESKVNHFESEAIKDVNFAFDDNE